MVTERHFEEKITWIKSISRKNPKKAPIITPISRGVRNENGVDEMIP